MGLESVENRYLDGRAVLNCADATAAGVDDVVMKMLKEAYEEAKRLLSENRKALDLIAGFLIKKETITGKEFMDIFHKVQNGEEVLLPEEREEDSEVPKDSEAVEFAEATERSEAEAIKRSEAVETSKATEIPEASEEGFTKEK